MLFLLFFSSDDDGDDERCKREWIQELKQMCRYGGLIDAHTHRRAALLKVLKQRIGRVYYQVFSIKNYAKLCKIIQAFW
jgi:hypothetical protein